ncbi:hypothetical protein B0H13DRAFT_2365131 [Mycena leptocephala]|nr:hypothetical protein B0H13DRAFT_2365131 [Mycena leptocephala]
MFKNLVYPPTVALMAAVLVTTAKAEGCYNGGNTNALACYNLFSEDFCSDVVFWHSDFSVTGSGNSYSDCVFAMSQLAYFCPDTGGLKTMNGHQYKLDPNDGGSC